MKKNQPMKRQLLCLFAFLLAGMGQVHAQEVYPTVLPDAPTEAADQVCSIYCGYYTDVVSFTPSAGLMEVEVTVGETKEKMYHGKIGQGGSACYFDFGEQGVDLSAYNTLFLDVFMYEEKSTEFKFRLNEDKNTDIKSTLKQGWNRIRIDLNDYALMKPAPDLTSIRSIHFVGALSIRNICVDNVYATKTMDADFSQIATFPVPVPVHHEQGNDVLAIFSDHYPTQVGTNVNYSNGESSIRVKGGKYEGSDEVDAAIFYKNITGGTYATTFVAPVDISDYDSIHFDVFPLSGDVRMRLSLGKSTQWDFFKRTATKGKWNSFDIAISDYLKGLKEDDRKSIDLTAISKFTIFNEGGGARTFFLDNIYFYKSVGNATLKNTEGEDIPLSWLALQERTAVTLGGEVSGAAVAMLSDSTLTGLASIDLTGATSVASGLQPANPNCLVYASSSTSLSGVSNAVVDGVAETIQLTDQTRLPFCCPTSFMANQVTYTRTFTGTNEANLFSICLPFHAEKPEGGGSSCGTLLPGGGRLCLLSGSLVVGG